MTRECAERIDRIVSDLHQLSHDAYGAGLHSVGERIVLQANDLARVANDYRTDF